MPTTKRRLRTNVVWLSLAEQFIINTKHSKMKLMGSDTKRFFLKNKGAALSACSQPASTKLASPT